MFKNNYLMIFIKFYLILKKKFEYLFINILLFIRFIVNFFYILVVVLKLKLFRKVFYVALEKT